MGYEPNINTDFVGQKGFWAFYGLLCLFLRFFFGMFVVGIFGLSDAFSWTLLHVVHTGITFIVLHWVKGSPFWIAGGDQGQYDHLTFWEQIDHGRQYTRNKKIFTLIPIILSVLASFSVDWDLRVTFF